MAKNQKFNCWKFNKSWIENYNVDELYEWWITYYEKLSRHEKECVSSYMIDNIIDIKSPIQNIEEIIRIYHKKMSERASIGYKNYLKNASEAEVKVTKQLRSDNIKLSRIKKVKMKHPNITDDEALTLSYIDALITKGKSAAKILGLPADLSDAEFMKLSGYGKKLYHSKLTTDEKTHRRIEWKRENLKNKKIRNTIISEHIEFDVININELLEDEVEKWYSIYSSICSSKRIQSGQNSYSYCKSGFYYSEKNQRRYYYRSSYEYTTLCYLEESELVSDYAMEKLSFKYKRDRENFERRYRPDFFITYKDLKLILEVKSEYGVKEFIDTKLKYINADICIITEKQLETKEKFYEFIEEYSKQYKQNSKGI